MDLNIRDFPDELHRIIKSEAALKGMTLREFLIESCERIALFWEKDRKTAKGINDVSSLIG